PLERRLRRRRVRPRLRLRGRAHARGGGPRPSSQPLRRHRAPVRRRLPLPAGIGLGRARALHAVFLRMGLLMRHAWTLLVLSLLLIGCETLRLPASLALTEGDALTEGRTGARAHATPEAVAVPLRQAWRYNAEAGFGPAAVLVA